MQRSLFLLRSFAATSLVLTAMGPAHAAGQVTVRWIASEHFRDIGRNAIDREHTLAGLKEMLQQLGQQLPDGQTLALDVRDVDLAGEIQPGRVHDIRVLRDRGDWPRMSMHYTLRRGDTVLKSGDVDLADMGYFFGPPANGGYAYEKRMVERWIKAEIITR